MPSPWVYPCAHACFELEDQSCGTGHVPGPGTTSDAWTMHANTEHSDIFASTLFTASPQGSGCALDAWAAGLDVAHLGNKLESGGNKLESGDNKLELGESPATSSSLSMAPTEAAAPTAHHTTRCSTGSRAGSRPPHPGYKTQSTRKTPTAFPRLMTTSMSLRVLHIPKAMHAGLGLVKAYPLASNGRRANKGTVYLRGPDGVRHAVAMVFASGTAHRRFTDGWRAFCQHAGVRVGDTVTFRATDVVDELETVITRGR